MKPNTSFYTKTFYAIFICIILISIGLAALNEKIGIKELTIPLLSALSTFLGALFAFRLNETKEYVEHRNEQMSALKRSLFILARQSNAINSIHKLLEPYNSVNERAFNLAAYKPPTYSELKQNFEDLEFLLNSEYVNLLMELTVEEDRFHQAFESLRIRSEFYVSEVLPMMVSQSLLGKILSDEELFDAFGERIFGTAVNYSNNMYYHIFETKNSISTIHNNLFKVSKSLFPNEKFIKSVDTI